MTLTSKEIQRETDRDRKTEAEENAFKFIKNYEETTTGHHIWCQQVIEQINPAQLNSGSYFPLTRIEIWLHSNILFVLKSKFQTLFYFLL